MAVGWAFWCNAVWVVADTIWSFHFFKAKEWDAFVLFAVYTLIGAFGVVYLWPW